MALLSRARIEAALTALNAELAKTGDRASRYRVGGAVMCLVRTKDVDGW